MFGKRDTDVLVVGAGPVGLLTALQLEKRGVRVEIYDKDWRTAAHSYGLALHGHSLALLDEVGVLPELLEEGRKVLRMEFHDADGKKAEIDFSRLGGDYPFVLALAQSAIEDSLENRLREKHIPVHWNHRVQTLADDGTRVLVDVAKLDKVSTGYPVARMEWEVTGTVRVRASYVAGADGYHSLARRALDIDFADRGGLESFAVFEFEMTEDPGDAARVYLHDHGTDVFWPMKDGRCRWNFHVDSVGEDRVPSLEELHRLLKTRAPGFPLPEKLYWSSFVMFDRRVAESYGRGRIRLAGDAAHLTGPVGAQSMNVGLDEACDLAERLAGIIRDDAPSELLDTYGEARRADWLDILGETGAPKPGAECSEWVASRAGGILPCVPASGADLDALLGQLGLAAVRTQAGV